MHLVRARLTLKNHIPARKNPKKREISSRRLREPRETATAQRFFSFARRVDAQTFGYFVSERRNTKERHDVWRECLRTQETRRSYLELLHKLEPTRVCVGYINLHTTQHNEDWLRTLRRLASVLCTKWEHTCVCLIFFVSFPCRC